MLNLIWGGMILVGVIYAAVNGTMQEVNAAAMESAREAVTLCITMLGVMGLWLGMMEVARASGIMDRLTKLLRPFLHFLFPDIPKGHRCLEPISVNIISNLLGLGWAATPAGLAAMEELAKLEQERGNAEYIESAESIERIEPTRYAKSTKSAKVTESGEYKAAEKDKKKTGQDALFAKPAANHKGHKDAAAKKTRGASNEMCTFLVLNISSLQLIPVNVIAYRAQYGSVNPAAMIVPAMVATFFSTVVAVVCCKVMGRRPRA